MSGFPAWIAWMFVHLAFLTTFVNKNEHERKKIFWRGDRIEWVLAHGFHEWMAKEIAEDRVLWPAIAEQVLAW